MIYHHDRGVTDFGIPAFKGLPVEVPAATYYGAANARLRLEHGVPLGAIYTYCKSK